MVVELLVLCRRNEPVFVGINGNADPAAGTGSAALRRSELVCAQCRNGDVRPRVSKNPTATTLSVNGEFPSVPNLNLENCLEVGKKKPDLLQKMTFTT